MPGTWYEERPDGFVVGATTRTIAAIGQVPFACAWAAILASVTADVLHRGHGARFILPLVPFWLLVALLVWFAALSVFGRYVVTVTGDRAEVLLALGFLGWRRRFSWSGVTRVTTKRSSRRGGPDSIVLEGRRRILFGAMVRRDRRDFLRRILEQRLGR